MKISAVIITYNEERNIGDAVRSVLWADEIFVVDSESTDRTREIARDLGARVVERPWPGFAAQKQFAADNAGFDWILSIDADERVTEELTDEILKVRENGPTNDGYTIPRLSIYMGRKIRHGGWYPDRQLRLFDRRKARWKDRIVHESVAMVEGGSVGKLTGDILHFSVDGPEEHARMVVERYAPLSARQMLAEGRRTSGIRAVGSAISTFLRTYFLKLGIFDGLPGLLISYFAAHNSLLKHVILLDLQDKEAARADPSPTTTKTLPESSNLP